MTTLISTGASKQPNNIPQAKPSFETPSLKDKEAKAKGMSPHCRQGQDEGTWAVLTHPLSSCMSCHGLSLQVHRPVEPSALFLSYWYRCGRALSSYCIFICILSQFNVQLQSILVGTLHPGNRRTQLPAFSLALLHPDLTPC